MNQLLMSATVALGLTAIAACGSGGPEAFADTIEMGIQGEPQCHVVPDSPSQLCVTPLGGDRFFVEAKGLVPSSDVDFEGSKGDTMHSEADPDGTYMLEIGGQIVADDFNVEATLVTSEDLGLTVVVG